MVSKRRHFNFILENKKKSQGAKSVRRVVDNRNFVCRQKLLGDDGSVSRCVVMVKQPGLFWPKLGKMSSHFYTQSPQNFAVEPGIHRLGRILYAQSP